jgi:integrase
MGIYLREGSPFYYYRFKVDGREYRGSTGTRSKAEARAAEAQARTDIKNPKRDSVSVLGVCERWLQHGEGRRLDIENDRSRVRKLLGEVEGKAGLIPSSAFMFLDWEIVAQLVKARRAEGNAPATINRELALIQALIAFAKGAGLQYPALDLRQFRLSEKNTSRTRWLALEEERALLRELTGDPLDLAILLLDTGGRYEEITSLRWSQVSLDTATVTLNRTKTGTRTTLGLTSRAHGVLRRRMSLASPFVFPSDHVSGHKGHTHKAIMAAMHRAGINPSVQASAHTGDVERAVIHTLRHTFASRLVQAGVPLKEVAHLLGHSTSVMVEKVYGHLCPITTASRAASVLDGLTQEETSSATE